MPHRFQVFERIAFSLVVLSALVCTAFIAYERYPDVQIVLHAGEEALSYSGQYGMACGSPYADTCGQLTNNWSANSPG